MRETIINQRKERDHLLAQSYLPRRTMYKDIEAMLNSPVIKLITGPRRVGKSTQALLMLKGRNFAYLNFDDNNLLDKWNEDLVMLMLDEIYPGYQYLMLDEVQNVKCWDVWVSKLYRRGVNLVITGSNANMLSGEMATLLTGRYLEIKMFPFSLQEVFDWNNLDNKDTTTSSHVITRDDYLRNGGYPETVARRAITQSYLASLFDAILLKDVVKRHKVRNVPDLNSIALYLLANFGNPLSYNDIASSLGLASVSTVKKFVSYLHEPYLFYSLPRYNNKLKLMKKAPQKSYVIDNGFITACAFNTSSNLGRLLENQVMIELLRQGYEIGLSLFYYKSRNDKETDFVVRKGAKVERLIQVCYDISSEKTLKREIDSIAECAGELKCDNLTIVTNNDEGTIEKNGYTIQLVPINKFE